MTRTTDEPSGGALPAHAQAPPGGGQVRVADTWMDADDPSGGC